jgi:hypothetical protein
MRLQKNAFVLAFAGAAALAVAPPARAQISMQFHFGEDDYHRIDARHPLRGEQYQKMATLAHLLDETAQELSRQAYWNARREGDRSHARLLASVTDFSRRAADFHIRMDGYLDAPWDIRREVDDLTRRAQYLGQQVQNVHLFPRSYDTWNAEVDLLNRMQQLIHGANVEIPPPAVRANNGWWEHRNDQGVWGDDRDRDRDGNHHDRDDRDRQPPPPPSR